MTNKEKQSAIAFWKRFISEVIELHPDTKIRNEYKTVIDKLTFPQLQVVYSLLYLKEGESEERGADRVFNRLKNLILES